MPLKTLSLSKIKDPQSLYLVADEEVIDFKKLTENLKGGMQAKKHMVFRELFGNKKYFHFIGSCNNVESFISYSIDFFVISSLGEKVCTITGLPFFNISRYKGLKFIDCAQDKFILNVVSPIVSSFYSQTCLDFVRCGEQIFFITNSAGLQNVAQLKFDSCGMEIFKILDSSGLEQLKKIDCKYCGFQEFFIDSTHLTDVRSAYFYKCGLDNKFIFNEPKGYPNLQELIIDNCATDGDTIIEDTKGLKNLDYFELKDCSINEGQVVIHDVSFVKRAKTINIQNCSLTNPFVIEDTTTPLTLDETKKLFSSLEKGQNGPKQKMSGTIKIKISASTMTLSQIKQEIKKEKKSLIDKGWQVILY